MAFKNAQKFFYKHWMWILGAFVFFIGTFVIARFSNLFISPDETANFFFARAFSETGSFRVFDSANEIFRGALHPRSIITDGAYFLPGSFFGLSFLYGIVAFFFGTRILFFLATIFAILAAMAWGKLLTRWFSKPIATISAFLLLFHPAFWYYSARGFMPNVLFVSLLILGAYVLLERPILFHLKRCANRVGPLKHFQQDVDLVAVGLCFGFALLVRLSEIFWVVPLLIFLLYVCRKQILARCYLTILIAFLIPIIILLLLNIQTYGSMFITGYSFISASADTFVSNDSSVSNRLSFFFPFGIHRQATFNHLRDYLISLFWWLSGFALIGLQIMLFGGLKQSLKFSRTFIVLGFALVVWLGVWYGSWTFFDNPDPTKITIANSYIRYWLPLFVLSTPLIACAIVWISERAQKLFWKRVLLVGCLVFIFVMNFRVVFIYGPDSLLRVAQTLQDSKNIRAQILEQTAPNAVIIVDRSDKIFFPYRYVLYPLRSEKTYALMPNLVDFAPLYYYGITLIPEDFKFLNETKLKPLGLQMDFIQGFGIESLYQIKRP